MAFITKLDFSSNRQIKQFPETITVLSGATYFGVPFNMLPSGPDLTTTGITNTLSGLTSTFSGNSSITVFTWSNSKMVLANSYFSALTPLNSGITQNSGLIFTSNTTTTIDGNLVTLTYSGVSFDITPIYMTSSGGNYSGSVYTNRLYVLSAGTTDFTGRTIWVDVSGITRTDDLIVVNDATFENIGSQPSAGSLHYTTDGTLTTNTSDKRFKTNIQPIKNALSKILSLEGVYFNWKQNPDTDKRIGFIAQDVQKVVPELVFVNDKTPEKYLGVHYDNITSLLVEAIKELAKSTSFSSVTNTNLITQTVVAEDNNIELNYNGNKETSIGGGIKLLHALGDSKDVTFITNENGDWTTNNNLIPKGLILPFYTPKSKNDSFGINGSITYDNNFIYVKNNTWKRIKLEDIE